MTCRFDWDEQTFDLAAERFTVGLDREDERKLESRMDQADLDELECVVAAIHLGHLTDVEPLPEELATRLENAGRNQLAATAASTRSGRVQVPRAWARAFAWGGWLAAAALLLILVGPDLDGLGDVAARREVWIASATDLLRIDWVATDDPAAAGAAGDVVWSDTRQDGFMRFRGLAPNDPGKRQYQLWIFDSTRVDWEAKPDDGGVFDVPAIGEVVVPIDAKLPVREPALFAVTVEVPGGVVVSEREHVVLTATR